ncbi:MAG: hypothetical protein HEP71_34605 [Roseivirga sp.]|nr:hypothetical protein [Roseivirga sp.]
MEIDKEAEDAWLFRFAIESENDCKLERKKADQLMDFITEWAENNGCQIGGGYRAPEKDEFDPDKLFDED